MFTSEKHHRKSSFQLIKQDDKFFSKLLSKELNNTDDSFRVDNDGLSGGSVPFFWESRPGTPKHRFDETSIPPLTPPPSYFLKASCGKKWSPSPAKKLLSSKSNFLRILFLKGRGKKSSSPDMPPRNEALWAAEVTSQGSSSSLSDSSMNDGDPSFDGSPTSTLYPWAMTFGGATPHRGPVWPPLCR
ncbi:hypothetical protein CRG98_016678 [Punica granatum]|uniref:Uncharacterized protein n=1 Tax=Punica granatum TaxID=22663 RepID=A0A2I0K310_PUNGR|nr:hypothetical protein CRG98_016678 [Punica granatum]